MNRYPIILDTDPGLDDAIALLILSVYAKENLDTIISSYGNVSLEATTANVLRCCNLFDIRPNIIKGALHPTDTESFEDAANIHGADGLAGVSVEKADIPIHSDDPTEALYRRIQSLGRVDYITLGPLTNLALLLQKYPDAKDRIHRVITMGGGFGKGNITPYAEFNIYCDPAAAKYVCDARLDQLFVPLNATHQIALSMEEIDFLTRTKTVKSGYLYRILAKNFETNTAQGDEGCIIHDASAVIAYLFPECFTYSSAKTDVITESERRGETVRKADNIHTVAEIADREKIFDIIYRAIV